MPLAQRCLNAETTESIAVLLPLRISVQHAERKTMLAIN
ncbi:MAG: hypothetical protein ACK493_12955 [Planctomycetota bacterium]